MRKTLMIALMCAASVVHAKGSSHVAQDTASNTGGIITTDVATDGYSTSRFARDANGNTVVCPSFGPDIGEVYRHSDAKCTDMNGKIKWKYPQHTVPAGKTYVGFRFVTIVGTPHIEVYWK